MIPKKSIDRHEHGENRFPPYMPAILDSDEGVRYPRNDAVSQRIDKWLWTAHFFKSRSLATIAIYTGHVRIGNKVPKPSHAVRPGDTLNITLGTMKWTLVIRALGNRRGSAAEAQKLYEETAESRAQREKQQENQRLAPTPGSGLKSRPTKKARRLIHRFNESL